MAEAERRPTALTLVCIFVGVSALLVLVNLMSVLSDWGSIAMQDALREQLEAEPLASSGLGLEGLLSVLRIAAQVGIVVAIAAGIFALYVARGHEASRWALTAICVLGAIVFAAAGVAGLLPGAMAVGSVAVMWSRDSRRWFAVVNGRVPVLAPGAAAAPSGASAGDVGTASPRAEALPEGGSFPPHHATPSPHPGLEEGLAAARRPRSVEIAVWTAVGSSVLVCIGSLITLTMLTLGADFFREYAERPGFLQEALQGSVWTADGLIVFLRISTAAWLVIGLVGVGAALWARTGRRAGAIALMGMSFVTLALSLLATLGFLPFNLVTAVAAVVVVVQLRRPASIAWYSTRSRS